MNAQYITVVIRLHLPTKGACQLGKRSVIVTIPRHLLFKVRSLTWTVGMMMMMIMSSTRCRA
jgi:hypothetical protein